jgi:hypothetical protein
MGFQSGSISFRAYRIVGNEQPTTVDQLLLDKVSNNMLRPQELGAPEEVEYGWNGGRHILDGEISFANNVYCGGSTLFVGMRIDVNKVPGDVRRAMMAQEEEAVAKTNPSGFISKNQKRDVKESVRAKLDDELRAGKYRRSKVIQVLWDLDRGIVYSTAANAPVEKLYELFERTFGLELVPVNSGDMARSRCDVVATHRAYEDLRPTRFVLGAEGDGQFPEYPWVSKGAEPKNFVGNEFLLWLWYETELSGSVNFREGAPLKDITVFFDRRVDMDCTYGQTGKASLKGDGVNRSAEAIDSILTGKVPRSMTMLVDLSNCQYALTLSDTFSFSGVKLPEVEDAESPRVLFEERVASLGTLLDGMKLLFETFVDLRISPKWDSKVKGIVKFFKDRKVVVK